jgi:glycosyltransferase involved in cell wall biosynthesis
VTARRLRSLGARWRRPKRSGGPGVLVLLENLPLQRDARVKRQCSALLDAGFEVTVVCPRGSGPLPPHLAPVRLETWPSPTWPGGAAGHVIEYLVALLAMAVLTARVWVRQGFDVIQACNPPDFLFLIAAPYRRVGVRFVFDHHDPAPELFVAHYGPKPLVERVLRALERRSVRSADQVIATNGSLRAIACDRGGAAPDRVLVVRNGPTLASVQPRPARAELKGGRRHLCCWHGVMASSADGLDVALVAMAHLVHRRGRRDCHLALIGDGEQRAHLEQLARDLRIAEYVTFTGWLEPDALYDHLAAADVALAPDPMIEVVEKSTVMKVMEYMAFELPVVAFDVHETRVSAGPAGVYVAEPDPLAFAAAIESLLDDDERRRELGRLGRRRVEAELAWDHQQAPYIEAMGRLAGSASLG